MNNPFLNMKLALAIAPQAIKDNAEWVGSIGSTPRTIDTRGWDYMWVIGVVGDTDVAMAQYSLHESSDNSTYTEISAADFSTAATLPSASTDNSFQCWMVDLSKRKRYIRVEAIAGDGTSGTYLTVIAILGNRMGETPDTATERGLDGGGSSGVGQIVFI